MRPVESVAFVGGLGLPIPKAKKISSVRDCVTLVRIRLRDLPLSSVLGCSQTSTKLPFESENLRKLIQTR